MDLNHGMGLTPYGTYGSPAGLNSDVVCVARLPRHDTLKCVNTRRVSCGRLPNQGSSKNPTE
jgi:hypothetical protein